MKVKVGMILLIITILLTGCSDDKMAVSTGTVSVPPQETVSESVPVPEPTEEPVAEKTIPENVLDQKGKAFAREVNLFLSNFSEVYYDPVRGYYRGDEAKIQFAFLHASINEEKTTFYQDSYMGISAENVDRILKRFFGATVPHQTPARNRYWIYQDGNFLMPAASGDSYGDFTIAHTVTQRDDGSYDVAFNIYRDTSVVGGDVISDKSVYSLTKVEASEKYQYVASGGAVIKPKIVNASNTYELTSYSVSY